MTPCRRRALRRLFAARGQARSLVYAHQRTVAERGARALLWHEAFVAMTWMADVGAVRIAKRLMEGRGR